MAEIMAADAAALEGGAGAPAIDFVSLKGVKRGKAPGVKELAALMEDEEEEEEEEDGEEGGEHEGEGIEEKEGLE